MEGKPPAAVSWWLARAARFIPIMVGLALAALCAWMPRFAFAMEPVRPGQESSLIRAVFAEQRLWLLSDAGELSTITENGDERITQKLPAPVLDLCVSEGYPMVVTGGQGESAIWTLRKWINQTWSTVAVVPGGADHLVAINCTSGTATVLTTNRLITIGKDGAAHAVNLSKELSPVPRIVSATYSNADQFFVAINAGEWGGGLRRINRNTGKIVEVERNISGAMCGGPLNSSCDPVNGIAPEPWRPDCLAVAVGLVHMSTHGSVVEVCGDTIRPLYVKTYTSGMWAALLKGRAPPPETVAFFGLTSRGGTLWAAGTDGLYQIDEHGVATFTALPPFRTIGGIDVSFDNPQVVLVMTSANKRHSVSGSVPMLVPR
jgi:hypothetical protein